MGNAIETKGGAPELVEFDVQDTKRLAGKKIGLTQIYDAIRRGDLVPIQKEGPGRMKFSLVQVNEFLKKLPFSRGPKPRLSSAVVTSDHTGNGQS